jgi:hypothetical protein
MNPDFIFGPALLEAVRQVVRDELRAQTPVAPVPGLGPSRWGTPPQVARETGVPVKTIRQLIKSGRVQPRLRNQSPNPKQPKFLVNADEVAAAMALMAPGALAGSMPTGDRGSIDLEERAARIRAKGAGR